MRRARIIVTAKDRKYSLIEPFWLDVIKEAFMWKCEIDFGIIFSSQIRSRIRDASFWLVVSDQRGPER